MNLSQRRWLSFAIFVILASLDNAAAGVLPPLYAIIARDLDASEAGLGLTTAVYVLIVAIFAVGWGYWGDRTTRKPLILGGTAVWFTGMLLSSRAATMPQLFGWQMATAVGVGAVSAIGFSLVSDLVPAHRRGLALSLWSISQGLGAALGALLAGTLGAFNWRWPFVAVALLGLLFALLYLLIPEPQRGQAEPELRSLFASGHRYTHRIHIQDIGRIVQQPTTRWLLLQSFFFSLAYGATLWVPRWAIARVQAEGYPLETATIVGNLFVLLFSLGAFFSIFAGELGDRWQRRWRQARPTLALVGLIGSIPFFVALFFTPLRGVAIPAGGSVWQMGTAVAVSLFNNGWVLAAFGLAFVALALQASDPPNWAAMLTDANLPEHRGTAVGLSRLSRAVGNALSVGLAGLLFGWLQTRYPTATAFAIGLALFQLLVIPAGLCYLKVRQHIAADTKRMRQVLNGRVQQVM